MTPTARKHSANTIDSKGLAKNYHPTKPHPAFGGAFARVRRTLPNGSRTG